jgi:tRNA (guanosine-2'-O-)-methyltransferase
MRQVLGQRLAHVHCAVEAVYHRHNISAILRTCDALGVHTVHLVGGGDLRVSKGPARGAERGLDVRLHADATAALAWLAGAGVDVWVADLADPAVPPEAVPLERPVCLWFGAELVGVSETASAAAKGVMTIPMRGMAQSLNVSVAAALGLRGVTERARALGPRAFLPTDLVEATVAGWVRRDDDTALRVRQR